MARLSGDDLRVFVEASCARSCVTVKVTDALVVRSVTVLLTGYASADGDSRRAAVRSDAPHEIHPRGVEASRSLNAGTNGGVIEECFDDLLFIFAKA